MIGNQNFLIKVLMFMGVSSMCMVTIYWWINKKRKTYLLN